MMIAINLALLLAPSLSLAYQFRDGRRHLFIPFAFLYTMTSAFLSFTVLYFLKIKVSYAGIWIAFYTFSIVCAILVSYLFRYCFITTEKPHVSKFDFLIALYASSLLLLSYGLWQYRGSAAYYIWFDVCRFWRDTGFVFPELPKVNPSNSFLVGLAYNPVLASVLTLLTAGVKQEHFFNSWGILTGLAHVALLLTLAETSRLLFKNYAVGVITFFLFFMGDMRAYKLFGVDISGHLDGFNLLRANMMIGSHESATFYGAALLFLCWLLVWKEKRIVLTSLFVWSSLAFFSIRPYLAAFAGALGISIILIILRKERTEVIKRILRKEFLIPLGLAFLLGMVIFSWQIYMLMKYGSLVVYSHNVMLAGMANYSIPGTSVLARIDTFWSNFSYYIPSFVNEFLSINEPIIGYTLVSLPVFILFFASLLGWVIRSIKTRGTHHNWMHSLGLVLVLFFVVSIVINVKHWKTIAGWSTVFYLIAASCILMIFGENKLSHWFVRIVGSVFIVMSTIPPLCQQPWTQLSNPTRNVDPFLNEMGQLVKEKGGDVMVIRVEPGAEAYLFVPGKYYWNLRFLWNDCDAIMRDLQWDPEKVARALREQNIRWIYQPYSWNADNHAGLHTVKDLKAMLDKRGDLFLPVVFWDGVGHPDETLYMIALPGELSQREIAEFQLKAEHEISRILALFGWEQNYLRDEHYASFPVPAITQGFSATASEPFRVEFERWDGETYVEKFSLNDAGLYVSVNDYIKAMHILDQEIAQFNGIYHAPKVNRGFDVIATLETENGKKVELPFDQIAKAVDYEYYATRTSETFRLEPNQSITFKFTSAAKGFNTMTCVDILGTVSQSGYWWDYIKASFFDESCKEMSPSTVHPSTVVRYMFETTHNGISVKFTNPGRENVELCLNDIALY